METTLYSGKVTLVKLGAKNVSILNENRAVRKCDRMKRKNVLNF